MDLQLLAISWFWWLRFLPEKSNSKVIEKNDFYSFWQYLGFSGCFF